MKRKNIKYTLLALFLGIASQNFISAQCNKTDRECWFTEAISSIENEDFDNAKKYLRKAKNTKNGIAEAKKMWDSKRLSKYYEPLADFKNQFKTKHSAHYFRESLSALNRGLELGERNKKIGTESTQGLDENIHAFFEATIPVVEEERVKAVEEASANANANFEENNYQSALSKYEFVFREADDSNPMKLEASKRINECKYNIAITSAEEMYDNKKCEKAFDFAIEALQYDSTSNNAMIIRDDAADCAYEKIIITAEDQISSDKCEKAIKTYERGRKYYEIVQNETGLGSPEDGISSAKDCAAVAYLQKAKDFYITNNHKSAIAALKKAKYFSPERDILFEGVDYNALTLEEKFFENLISKGENAYKEGNSDLSRYNSAIKSFKGAAVYKDSTAMYDKVAYVQAVKKAQTLENNKEHLNTAAEQQELVDAWYRAKRLAPAADLNGGIDARSKYEEVNDNHTATLRDERQKADLKSSNSAVLESYFFESNNINIPKIKDDSDFGDEVNVTATVKWRVKTVEQNNVIQLRFHIRFKEKGGHCCDKTDSTYDITTDVITILRLPKKYLDHFKIYGNSEFGAEQHFRYDGRALDKLYVKGPPRRMDLESPIGYITDSFLTIENGKITFNYEPNPIRVGLVRQ
ncbi:hypothetical protein JQC67_16785 [Aurantibacter crassamenti]|uniref:hypothetical protein n=1 Tax=Aurantibacter crassamenti TaxID=1837375 RepID=UPI0019397D49|nr:hypothetical protein [Aurantibacter crassamenti]MBM1107813.1 hypothetical protein [Aurantibacter crassamenti]